MTARWKARRQFVLLVAPHNSHRRAWRPSRARPDAQLDKARRAFHPRLRIPAKDKA